MQKIDRNALVQAQIAGGTAKGNTTSNKSSSNSVVIINMPAQAQGQN